VAYSLFCFNCGECLENRRPIIRSLATALALLALAYLGLAFGAPASAQTFDSLPSWNNGKAKRSITAFVAQVTEQGSPDFVPPAERIAVFDNDGTLWAEQPMYFQVLFALDRVKALAPQHPEWRDKEPFDSLLISVAPRLLRLVETSRTKQIDHY